MATKSATPRRAKTETVLRPIHPNAGIEAEYRRALIALIDEMHRSVLYWVRAAYRATPPSMAQDAPDASGFPRPEPELNPAVALRRAVGKLTRRWMRRFNEAAPVLAKHFATSTQERADGGLRSALKNAGLTVEFKMTAQAREVAKATVNANVGLIKSIPQRYLADVEGIVMRSVQTGRDLEQLVRDLRGAYGVTKRRAATIALDQNNKATSAILHARQAELGIDEAIWMHSGGGRHPRPTHVKAGRDKVRYSVKEGWLDPALKKRIWPGSEIHCRCTSRPVIKGFSL